VSDFGKRTTFILEDLIFLIIANNDAITNRKNPKMNKSTNLRPNS